MRALQAYVARVPRSPHAAEAQRLIDDLTWNAVDKNSVEALQTFIDQNGASRHRADAQSLIERVTREREVAEARRKAAAQERDAIRAALQRFNEAFLHKSSRELKQIWPGASSDWTDSMNQRGAYFVATLSPAGEPDVTGARATIRCDLSTQTIIRGQPQPLNRKTVRVTLRKSGDQWLIEDPRGTE